MVQIGKIVHWFDKINVAVIKLSAGLKVGDKVKVGDSDGAFEQEIKSMQVDHKEIKSAKSGDEVGIKLDKKTHRNANVYSVE